MIVSKEIDKRQTRRQKNIKKQKSPIDKYILLWYNVYDNRIMQGNQYRCIGTNRILIIQGQKNIKKQKLLLDKSILLWYNGSVKRCYRNGQKGEYAINH